MKLEKWALIAEVIGSVAIVVTLVVLIIELRGNTELSRIAAYSTVTQDFDMARRFRLSNAESFDLFFRFNAGTLPDMESEPEQAMKTVLVILNEFSQLERGFIAYQAGIVGDNEWKRIHRAECQSWGLLRASEYLSPVTFRLTDNYVDHLNTTCTPEVVNELRRTYSGKSEE